MTIELLVTDIHNGIYTNPANIGKDPRKLEEWENHIEGYYSQLEDIIKKHEVERTFLGGDFSERIDYKVVKAEEEKLLAVPQFQQMMERAKEINSQIKQLVEGKYEGSIQKLEEALQSGSAGPEEQQLIQDNNQISQLMKLPFKLESQQRYSGHNAGLARLKEVCPELYATYGNHDTEFIPELLTNASFGHLDVQPLLDEKILMGYNCGYGPDVQEAWSGPQNMLAPRHDDHPGDLNQSPIHQLYGDAPVDLMVVHNSGNHDDMNRYPSGKGFTKIADENQSIVYCGHLHHSKIYKSKSGVLIIRLGPDYAAVVNREGKKVLGLNMIKLSVV